MISTSILLNLLWGKFWQSRFRIPLSSTLISYFPFHNRWVISVSEYRIGEPPEFELQRPLGSIATGGAVCLWFLPITIQSDPNLTFNRSSMILHIYSIIQCRFGIYSLCIFFLLPVSISTIYAKVVTRFFLNHYNNQESTERCLKPIIDAPCWRVLNDVSQVRYARVWDLMMLWATSYAPVSALLTPGAKTPIP